MNKFLFPLILLAALCMSGCLNEDEHKDVVKEISMSVSEVTGIMYDLFDDKQEHPIECMLVMEEGGTQQWQPLGFGSIEGFTYEKGHSYELKVKKTILANPPQDALNCTYKLVRILDDRVISEPEIPVEKEITSESDITYYELCPFDKYAIDTDIRIDKDGNIFKSNGFERPSYDMARIYVETILDKGDPNWIKFNSIPYMVYYAYVISPLSDKIRFVYTSNGGPMLKDVIPAEEFRYITDTLAEGDELNYKLILANVYKFGLQKLEFTVHKGI